MSVQNFSENFSKIVLKYKERYRKSFVPASSVGHEIPRWTLHNRGIGLAIHKKHGFVEGGGIGRRLEGRPSPIESLACDGVHGLGYASPNHTLMGIHLTANLVTRTSKGVLNSDSCAAFRQNHRKLSIKPLSGVTVAVPLQLGLLKKNLINGSSVSSIGSSTSDGVRFGGSDALNPNHGKTSSSDQTVVTAFKTITRIAAQLNIPRDIVDKAKVLFKDVHKGKNLKGNLNNISACLLLACRQEGFQKTVQEICFVSKAKSIPKVERCCKIIFKAQYRSVESVTINSDLMPGPGSKLGMPILAQRASSHLRRQAMKVDDEPSRDSDEGVCMNFLTSSSEDHDRIRGLQEISNMAVHLNLSRTIVERAKRLFECVHAKLNVRGHKTKVIGLACLSLAFRKEICDVGKTEQNEMESCIRSVLDTLDTTTDIHSRHLPFLCLPSMVQSLAFCIARKAVELDVVPEFASISVAAAAIYMASHASENKLTMDVITDETGVADDTIHLTYELMYPRAKELFPESFKFTMTMLPFRLKIGPSN